MTVTIDLGQPINLDKLYSCVSKEGKNSISVTGKCGTFEWMMDEIGLIVIVSNDHCYVKNDLVYVKSYPERSFMYYLDAMLRINEYYSEPVISKRTIFVLENENTKYVNRLFKSLTWKLYDGKMIPSLKSTALVYNSGKIVLLGCKNNQEISDSLKYIMKYLRNKDGIIADIAIEPISVKIGNIVKSGSVSLQKIKLSSLFKYLQEKSSEHSYIQHVVFEPELFPSLKCNINNITCLVFSSSKIILTGSIDDKQMNIAYDLLTKLIVDNDTNDFVHDLLVTKITH